jgi:hypothetical protein
MFHWQNEIFFGRRENGDVRVIKFMKPPVEWPDAEREYKLSEAQFDFTIPADSWGSIVASVSHLGEQDRRWFKAMEFHNEHL